MLVALSLCARAWPRSRLFPAPGLRPLCGKIQHGAHASSRTVAALCLSRNHFAVQLELCATWFVMVQRDRPWGNGITLEVCKFARYKCPLNMGSSMDYFSGKALVRWVNGMTMHVRVYHTAMRTSLSASSGKGMRAVFTGRRLYDRGNTQGTYAR